MTLRFFVHGHARPAGSKRAFVLKRRDGSIVQRSTGAPAVNVVDVSGEAGRQWRQDVRAAALAALSDRSVADRALLASAPLRLEVVFLRDRPSSHLRRNGTVKPSAPLWPTARPDTTKLLRAVEDALTGLVWCDDSSIVDQRAVKRYCEPGEPCGVRISIEALSGSQTNQPTKETIDA